MKQLATILVILSALSAFAQESAAPSGTPAQMALSNGKKATVKLQKFEGGVLTIQLGSKMIPVPADKLDSLKFAMNKEEFDAFREQQVVSEEAMSAILKNPDLGKLEKLELFFSAALENIALAYNQGDSDRVIALLEPVMKERGQYMAIENNLQDSYLMLMESYRKVGNVFAMRKCASVLRESRGSVLADKARASLVQVALAADDAAAVGALMAEIESEAAQLYLKACIQRAEGEAKAAIQTVTGIIADHANDVDWMAPSEFLGAQLYLDLAMTNSAAITARQVKNIYAGTSIAAEAAQLYAQLQPAEEDEPAEEVPVVEESTADAGASETME